MKPLRPQTSMTYRSRFDGTIRPRLGEIRLRDLTTSDLDDAYRYWLGEGLSARTVQNFHKNLGSALRQAEKWGYLDGHPSPVRNATPPTSDSAVESIPDTDLRRILKAAREKGGSLRLLVEVLATTGCRRGEALGLHWSDIDFKAKTVTIQRTRTSIGVGPPKTKAGFRTVDLPDDVVELLRDQRGDPDASVVALSPSAADVAWRRLVCQDLGLSYHMHQVRHAVASRLVDDPGVPITEAARILGHDVAVLLKKYTHANKDKRTPVTISW